MHQLWTRQDKIFSLKHAVFFTLAQMIICLVIAVFSSGPNQLRTPYQAYLRLNQWDSFRYQSIVESGYRAPRSPLTAEDVHTYRANVTQFPGYPAVVYAIGRLLRMPTLLALPLTSQLLCFLFWLQFFLVLMFWKISKKQSLYMGLAVLVFPSSYYLVTGYSESLFVVSLLSFILGTEVWIDRTGGKKIERYWVIACFSGFVLSATRLVGLPLVLYPVFVCLSNSTLSKKMLKRLDLRLVHGVILGAIASLGGLSFFAFCYFFFNRWDIYFKLQELGWSISPNYLGIFDLTMYIPRLFLEDTYRSVSRASNLFILLLLIALGLQFKLTFRIRASIFRQNIGLYALAWIQFFICISGTYRANMDSMVRYNLPIFVLIALIGARVVKEVDSLPRWVFWGGLVSLIFQIWMICSFTRGGWVA